MTNDPKSVHMRDQSQEAIRDLARLVAAYMKELMANGLTREEALLAAMQYQSSFVTSMIVNAANQRKPDPNDHQG